MHLLTEGWIQTCHFYSVSCVCMCMAGDAYLALSGVLYPTLISLTGCLWTWVNSRPFSLPTTCCPVCSWIGSLLVGFWFLQRNMDSTTNLIVGVSPSGIFALPSVWVFWLSFLLRERGNEIDFLVEKRCNDSTGTVNLCLMVCLNWAKFTPVLGHPCSWSVN